MSVTNPLSQYQETQFKTATPGRLLVMTFDSAIRSANAALEKMREQKLDEQSSNIGKVQNILLELISSLDMGADKQLATNLYSLYSYMFDKLTHANIHDDSASLEETIRILMELRDTWAEAERMVRTGATQPALAGAKAA